MPRGFYYGVLPFIFLLSFSVYLATLNPTFQPDDSAETVAACVTLTPQHPSGYPLYTLLGSLAVHLPLGSGSFRVNLLAAFLGALGAVFTALYLFRMTMVLSPNDRNIWVAVFSALGGSLILAFSRTYWAQAISAKGGIYILQSFVFLASLYLAGKGVEKPQGGKVSWVWPMMAWLGGLGAANGWEMTILFGTAGLVYFLLQRPWAMGKSEFETKNLLRMSSLGLVGLSLYLFLPLRPGQREIMVWGDTQSWTGLVHFLSNLDSREEFGLRFWRNLFHFSTSRKDWEGAWRQITSLGPQLGRISDHLMGDSGLWTWFLLVAGLFYLFHRKKHAFLVFGLATILLLIAANGFIFHSDYENLWCIDKFLIPADVFKAVCAGVGTGFLVLWAAGFLKKRTIRGKKSGAKGRLSWFPAAGLMAALLVPSGLLLKNFSTHDQSSQTWAYDDAADLMKSLKKNALFFAEGDNPIFSVLFFQEVLRRRMDVTLVPSYYLWAPWGGKELERKLGELSRDFSKAEAPGAGARVFSFLSRIIQRNRMERPLQFSANLDLLDRCYFSLQPAVIYSGSLFNLLRPYGLSLDWRGTPEEKGLDLLDHLRNRYPAERGGAAQGAMDILFAGRAQAFFNAAEYCARAHWEERADRYYQTALGQTRNPKLLGRIWQGWGDFWLARGRSEESLKAYQNSIDLVPDQISYAKLIRVYLRDRRFSEALEMALKSVELFPDSAAAWKDMAACEAALGKEKEAQEAFRQASRLKTP